MDAIVVTDDELKRLEKRFGPGVRRMGPWNSDGNFGYSNVPIVVVEKAAESLENPGLTIALSRLKNTSARTKTFIELLEMFGPVLVQRIVAAYQSLELMTGTHIAAKPPNGRRMVSVTAAAGQKACPSRQGSV